MKKKMMVDTTKLKMEIERLIHVAAGFDALTSEERFEYVVEQASKWLDDEVKWGWLGPLGPAAESIDGGVFRQILGVVVQLVYDQVKTAGGV